MFPVRSALPLLLLGALPLSAQQFPVTKTAAMEAQAYLAPLPANGVVSLATIAGDFAKNPTAAIGKYSGRRITVIGRIAKLGQGQSENVSLTVTLQDPAASLPAVKAKFSSGSIAQNSEFELSPNGSNITILSRGRYGNIEGRRPYLAVDQEVAIKGDFKEQKVGDIILTNCRMIPKEEMHALRQRLK